MYKKLFILLSFFLFSSLIAKEVNKEEISQKSHQSIYESKLECEHAFSTGTFQSCWLQLSHDNRHVKTAEIFINGGMPEHSHGLPTSPKAVWSEDKNAYVIHGLKFSMPGKWSLNFRVNAKDNALKDQITMLIEVD